MVCKKRQIAWENTMVREHVWKLKKTVEVDPEVVNRVQLQCDW